MMATTALFVLLALGAENAPPAEDGSSPASDAQTDEGVEMNWKTLGGLQWWADVLYFDGWRIQKHAWLETYRLLDSKDRCWRLGKEDDCLRTLKEQTGNPELTPSAKQQVVLLLHGIIRTRHSMRPIQKLLEQHGFRCYSVAYPSTRLPVEDHAQNLKRIVANLPEASEISFVCHSMGGLVVRAMLAEHSDPRIQRIVMMGTPNRGAERANWWSNSSAYRLVMGPAGQQLVTTDAGIVGRLPLRLGGVEVGVIAGGKGNSSGYSWTLQGDNDGTVTVESTKLDGARDFLIVRAIHTFLMNSKVVQEATLKFLQHGYFVSEEARNPISLHSAPAENP